MLWQLGVVVLGGVVLLWLVLVVALWCAAPDETGISDALRLLPDVLRLVGRLARDNRLPRGVRARLWLLLAYLAFPIDLVPDFLLLVGHADDAIIVALVLRSTIRRAGPEALRRHWPGTDEGVDTLMRLCRVPPA